MAILSRNAGIGLLAIAVLLGASRAEVQGQTKEDVSQLLALAETFAEVARKGYESGDSSTAIVGQAAGLYEKALEASEKAYGAKSLQTSDIAAQFGEFYVSVGLYERAEPLVVRAINIRQPQIPADHIALSANWNDLGKIYAAKDDFAKAEGYFKYALKVREAKKNNYLIASTAYDLGQLYVGHDDYAKAEPLLVRSIKLREGEKNQLDLARSLDALGKLYKHMGRYREAEPVYARGLAICDKEKGKGSFQSCAIQENLAEVRMHLGRYSEAEALVKEVLNSREKTPGKESLLYADALHLLADILTRMSRFSEALDTAERCVKITEAKVGPDNWRLIATLNNLAVIRSDLGQYAAAESLYRRVLKAQQKRSETSPRFSLACNNLGHLYVVMGRYADAEPLFQRAIKVLDSRGDGSHPEMVMPLVNLASMYVMMGQDDKAETLYRQALKIQIAILGQEHPQVATTLNNIGLLYVHRGQGKTADEYLQHSLEMRKKIHGEEHVETAVSMNNLGAHYNRASRYSDAEPLLRRSIEITEKLLGKDHPGLALPLNNVALSYTFLGRLPEAEVSYRRALAISESVASPDVTMLADNLSGLYALQQRWTEAAQLMDQASRALRRHVRTVLPILSEQEQLKFLQTAQKTTVESGLSLGLARAADPAVVSLSAGWLINGKAVAHQALAERTLLGRDSSDPKLASAIQELLSLRRRMANMAFNAPAAGQEDQHRRQTALLAQREQELAKQIGQAGGRPLRSDPWVELGDVRRALPKNAALIDIARFEINNFAAKADESRWLAPHYAAWVIPAEGQGEVHVIDLGETKAIEAAVKAARDALRGAPQNIRAQGEAEAEKALAAPLQALAKLVLHPLLPHVGSQDRWILSPDASLWLIPWAALPLPDGRYAVEKHQVSYVVSGRDLVQGKSKSMTNPTLIFADPDYDLSPDKAQASAKALVAKGDETAFRGASLSHDLPRVPPLPATAAEARLIQPSLEEYTKKPVKIYEADQALENVVKAVHSPRVLVLSTHGFFLPDQEVAPTNQDGAPSQNAVLTREGKVVENPLLRCGLLLAGCNQRGKPASQEGTDEDGVLAGLEIVGTDLRGTELVVLSACETGLGDVRNGEGVAGLRQAFQLAGAEAVVASLWQVPDRDTARLMNTFFASLAEGTPKAEAMRKAQLALIQARRERNGAAHPLFWAAFTLTGNADFLPVPERPSTLASASAYLDRGRAQEEQGALDPAIADYNEALKLDPKLALAYYERGWAYYRKGQNDRAIADYSAALEINPQLAVAYGERGRAHLRKEQTDAAIADLTEAIRLRPKVVSFYIDRSDAYRAKGDNEKALADCEQAIKLDERSSRAFAARGATYAEKNESAKAIADLSKAIELDPKYRFPYQLRGDAYRSGREYAKAIDDYTQLIRLGGGGATAFNRRGLAHFGKQAYDAAIADFTEAIRLDAKHHWAFANRGIAQAEKGSLDKAIADFDEALRISPKYGYAYNHRGLAYHEQHKYDQAIADFTAALEIEPKSYIILGNRAVSHQSKRDYAKATADYTEAIRLNPKNGWAYGNRGSAHAELKEWEQAAADYAKAMELRPQEPFYATLRASLHLQAGDADAFRKACQALLENFGKTQDPSVANTVAWICLLTPDAVADANQIVKLATPGAAAKPPKYAFIGTLGCALYRAGKFAEAIKSLKEAVTLEGKGSMPEEMLFLAMAYRRQGDAEQARQWLDKSVKWIDGHTGAAAAEPRLSWNRRLELQILRSEAEKLVQGAGDSK